MKTSYTILLLVFLFLSCTTSTRYKYCAEILPEIDSLSEWDVDSARVKLCELEEHMQDAPDEVRAYYLLLQLRVADYLSIQQNSDDLVSEVVNFYEKNAYYGHLPEAYYYAGRINSDKRYSEKALNFFQMALFIDTCHLSHHLQGRIYTQIGNIYLRNDILSSTMDILRLAYYHFGQSKDIQRMNKCDKDLDSISTILRQNPEREDNKDALQKIQRINTQVAAKIRFQEELEEQKRISAKKQWIGMGITASLCVIFILLLYRNKLLSFDKVKADSCQPIAARKIFYHEEINQILEKRIRQNKILNETDWLKIYDVLSDELLILKERLYSVYSLSETEFHVCILIKLDVPPSRIAKLIATSSSNISLMRQRMQHKFFNGEGTAKDWDTFVLSL